MSGKIIVGIIVVTALVSAAAMYYLQVYAYYEPAKAPANGVVMTTYGGSEERIIAKEYQGIDAESSPIRFRACFKTPHSLAMLSETFETYADAVPLTAPNWFDCFDAEQIASDMSAGKALAFLGQKNIAHGVDRIVVVHEDGRAFAWHQLNDCGETDYAGNPVGEACPTRDEGGN